MTTAFFDRKSTLGALLTSVLGLTVLALVWFAYTAFHIKGFMEGVDPQIDRIEVLRGNVTYYDEVLTMSARMAATTGDPRWKARYAKAGAQLDETIKELRNLTSSTSARAQLDIVFDSNEKLVSIEAQAFDLSHQGRLTEATALLDSNEYAQHKKVYANGIARLGDYYEGLVNREVAYQKSIAKTSLLAAFCLVPTIIVFGLLLVRTGKKWNSLLEEKARKLTLANEELQIAKEMADEANRAKSWFLSRMSHELRTPLNAILGFGSFLEEEDLTERQRQDVAQINRCGRHLLELVNDVLDITRFEIGSNVVSYETVDAAEVVAEAVRLMDPVALKARVTLAMEPSRPRYAIADRRRLRQVALNLLSNAIKYNVEGGKVTVSLSSIGPEHLEINFVDTGVGIGDDVLQRLFTPFDRMGANHREIEGTGLGLVLTKTLVESMGGQISVKSKLNEGSTFSVRLVASDYVSPADQAQPAVHTGSSAKRILIVEDNPLNIQLLRSLFHDRSNVRLSVATRGKEGLDLAHEIAPNVILLDINLPDLSGRDVLKALKEDPLTAPIPVIVVTAVGSSAQAMEYMELGAFAHIQKPIILSRLLESVESAIGEVNRAA